MQSPITGKDNAILEREIPSSFIIEKYKQESGLDVSHFFRGINAVSIYSCPLTGYRFYHPFNITGDDTFYQALENEPGYYMDSKWEHAVAEKWIKTSDHVLEIGCARGSFLKKARSMGATVQGLEMNSSAVAECEKSGIPVKKETVEKFAEGKKEMYNVVCSFQVLEHAPEVRSFLDSSLSLLKPGGLLIVSVPNNDSFVLKDDIALNMPPHHMGLWNSNSLMKLQDYFDIKIESIQLEPLQKYHAGFADTILEKEIDNKLKEKLGPLSPLVRKPAMRLARLTVAAMSEYIIGQTVLAVYRKV